jgi:protein disulfide-isomerase A6
MIFIGQCIVANVDGDDQKNKDLAKKYGVSGFPTIKFFSKDNKDTPEDYDGGRSELDFVTFLNEKCGTHRAVDGGLNDQVSLDSALQPPIARLIRLQSPGWTPRRV